MENLGLGLSAYGAIRRFRNSDTSPFGGTIGRNWNGPSMEQGPFPNRPKKCWISDADSSALCQLSLPEDAIPRKRMGIRHAERVPENV
jgi:hypothetical protein